MLDIKSQTREDLAAQFLAWGEKKYRVAQVLEWLYGRGVTEWEAMTNLPQALRERLAGHYTLHTLALVTRQGAPDQTQKFLWRLPDGALIESVLVPASPALYSESSDRRTLCVSTQVGCAYGCRFCASGLDGWKRHLTAEEIVEQWRATERWLADHPEPPTAAAALAPAPAPERQISNLVIMGMGEPLANYAPVMRALTLLNAAWGGAIGARKITISTCGLPPQIRQLAQEPLQFRLAISLHGATDAVRNRLMPVNRKYPLHELVAACEYYLSKQNRMLLFEYVLVAGVNDGLDQVPPLAQLARRLHARINLIPFNPVAGLPWHRPAEPVMAAFLQALRAHDLTVTLRREKGETIDAACGQLRFKAMKD